MILRGQRSIIYYFPKVHYSFNMYVCFGMLERNKFVLCRKLDDRGYCTVTLVSSSQSKELANTLRESTMSYKEFSNMLSGVVNTVKPLKRLIGEPNVEAKSSRLIAAGMALIAFPDPTITDLIGTTLVAAGLMKNRMQRTTVAYVYREFQKVTMKLKDLRQKLTINTSI